jgi:hypothetical protein
MRVPDKLVSRAVLAPMAPIALLLAGWWGSLPALGDSPTVGVFALSGLAIGLVLDATALRRWTGSLFSMGDRALLLVALFYSIGMYGFFMGFPVFNAAIGIVGGYAVAHRAVLTGWTRERAARDARRVAIAMTWTLGALCVATAWMALNEATMGAQLQQMLGLPFAVTWPMIYAIIGVGGTGLLVFQYVATVLVARRFAPR